MATTSINDQTITFHDYAQKFDAEAPFAHFPSRFLNAAVLLRPRGASNKAEGTVVRLMAIRYDDEQGMVVADVATIGADQDETITLNPADYDVYIPRGGDVDAHGVSKAERDRGKLRTRFVKRFMAIHGATQPQATAIWEGHQRPILDGAGGKGHLADAIPALTAYVEQWLAENPAPAKASKAKAAPIAARTNVSLLKPIKPLEAPTTPTRDMRADAVANAKAAMQAAKQPVASK